MSEGERPLVLSVGAVMASWARSPLARPLEQPRLVAHGTFAVTLAEEDLVHPEAIPLAGTSVATVVTSAAAAAV